MLDTQNRAKWKSMARAYFVFNSGVLLADTLDDNEEVLWEIPSVLI